MTLTRKGILMGNKIMLNITLPATRKSYDLNVPSCLSIQSVARLIASILAKHEPDLYIDKGDVALMDKRTGRLLNPGITVKDANLVNGYQLVLV